MENCLGVIVEINDCEDVEIWFEISWYQNFFYSCDFITYAWMVNLTGF